MLRASFISCQLATSVDLGMRSLVAEGVFAWASLEGTRHNRAPISVSPSSSDGIIKDEELVYVIASMATESLRPSVEAAS